MENLINQFNEQRTAKNLQRIKNAGIQPKELINNEWKPLNSWQDGFTEFHEVLPLYDKINGVFTIISIGFYKKLDK